MNKITDKIKILLGIAKRTFGKVTTENAEIFFDGDELAVDTKVYDENGDAVADGEYSDGVKIYTIKDSVVTDIRPIEEPKEEVVEEEKTETTETTEEKEEVTEELEDETITEEVKEEVVEESIEPTVTLDERVAALEELVEALFNEIREMKVREVEQATKNENIIREFSCMKRSPSAESITKDNKAEKEFTCEGTKSDRLKALKDKR
ncbi:MAG: hypothetical protein IKP45_05615 [Bacteroidales bacterium]|nr:hypothetical protein [Bacteroidales bacterium]